MSARENQSERGGALYHAEILLIAKSRLVLMNMNESRSLRQQRFLPSRDRKSRISLTEISFGRRVSWLDFDLR